MVEVLEVRVVVFDGTQYNLNKAGWAPNFCLPTMATANRQLLFGYGLMDVDLGEFFLKFPLPQWFCKYCRVQMDVIKEALGREENQPSILDDNECSSLVWFYW